MYKYKKKQQQLRKPKRQIKQTVKEETLNKWNLKVKYLTMQGDFIQILSDEQDNITWKSIVYITHCIIVDPPI